MSLSKGFYPAIRFLRSAGPEELRRWRAEAPRDKVFLWDALFLDRPAMRCLASLAGEVHAEDAIQADVEAVIGRAAKPFTPRKPAAGSEADASAGGELSGKLPSPGGPILFCPNNDTHAKMFAPVWGHLENARFLVFSKRKNERPGETLASLGVPFVDGSVRSVREIRPSCLVFGNDWNRKVTQLICEARRLGIPTVTLQEGCLDLGTAMGRLEWSDVPLIQGPIMASYFHQQAYLQTGNPRLDGLAPEPLPRRPKVMINSNFTYGVFEDRRDEWVHTAARACQDLGVDFFVCQHPRDAGQYPDYEVRRSDATKIHDFLRESSVLLSRFSTVIYEAMCLGRQVVYHNPHGETMRLFNEDETGALFKSRTGGEVKAAIEQAVEPLTPEREAAFDQFLTLHCGTRDGRAARRVAGALCYLARHGSGWNAPMPSLARRLRSLMPG
ncbi:MAG: hypothetical protein RLY93_12775 [Sumerlaeia bacterium]